VKAVRDRGRRRAGRRRIARERPRLPRPTGRRRRRARGVPDRRVRVGGHVRRRAARRGSLQRDAVRHVGRPRTGGSAAAPGETADTAHDVLGSTAWSTRSVTPTFPSRGRFAPVTTTGSSAATSTSWSAPRGRTSGDRAGALRQSGRPRAGRDRARRHAGGDPRGRLRRRSGSATSAALRVYGPTGRALDRAARVGVRDDDGSQRGPRPDRRRRVGSPTMPPTSTPRDARPRRLQARQRDVRPRNAPGGRRRLRLGAVDARRPARRSRLAAPVLVRRGRSGPGDARADVDVHRAGGVPDPRGADRSVRDDDGTRVRPRAVLPRARGLQDGRAGRCSSRGT